MRQRMTQPGGPNEGSDLTARRNRSGLTVFLLVCSLVIILASGLPPVLVAPALKEMLALTAIGAALMAAFQGESLGARHLTHWDQAAGFLALSLLAGFFVDPAALQAHLAEAAAGSEAMAPSALERYDAQGGTPPAVTATDFP